MILKSLAFFSGVCYTISSQANGVKPMKIDHESLIGTFEQKKAQVQQFNLMHDDFFAVVMQDKAALQTTLRILLSKADLIVNDVRVQYSVRNLVGHSAVLDVLAEDSTGKLYNIEVQVRNADDYQKRTRYYQANMDVSFLRKGKHYSELPDIYIIFIASFDLFGKNDVRYEVKRVLDGYQETVDNGVHELYFNTKANDHSEIAKLLQYFENTDDSVRDFGALSDAVRFYKGTEEVVSAVCDEVRRYGDNSAERAHAEARVQLVSNLMKNMDCSLEKALSVLGISTSEYQQYVELLDETKSA